MLLSPPHQFGEVRELGRCRAAGRGPATARISSASRSLEVDLTGAAERAMHLTAAGRPPDHPHAARDPAFQAQRRSRSELGCHAVRRPGCQASCRCPPLDADADRSSASPPWSRLTSRSARSRAAFSSDSSGYPRVTAGRGNGLCRLICVISLAALENPRLAEACPAAGAGRGTEELLTAGWTSEAPTVQRQASVPRPTLEARRCWSSCLSRAVVPLFHDVDRGARKG